MSRTNTILCALLLLGTLAFANAEGRARLREGGVARALSAVIERFVRIVVGCA